MNRGQTDQTRSRNPRLAKRRHRPTSFRPLVEPLESRRLLSVAGTNTSELLAAYGQTPMSFEPNQGQTDAQVQYLSRGNGYTLFLAASEALLGLQQPAT